MAAALALAGASGGSDVGATRRMTLCEQITGAVGSRYGPEAAAAAANTSGDRGAAAAAAVVTGLGRERETGGEVCVCPSCVSRVTSGSRARARASAESVESTVGRHVILECRLPRTLPRTRRDSGNAWN